MLEMSWITAILQLYSQVADRFGNVIVKRINIRLFDLLARFHYILNLPRTIQRSRIIHQIYKMHLFKTCQFKESVQVYIFQSPFEFGLALLILL